MLRAPKKAYYISQKEYDKDNEDFFMAGGKDDDYDDMFNKQMDAHAGINKKEIKLN